MKRDYQYYKKSFQDVQMPFAFLDREVLDENINALCERSGNKKIRIATKSIRCTWVFDYLLEKKEQIQGLMCYTVQEAAWLAGKGFDDLLVAYPCFHEKDIESIIPHLKNGKTIYLMADLDAHLEQIQQVAKKHDISIPVCLDMDMTTTFPGVYFGVYRSSVKDLASAKKYFSKLKDCPNLCLGALMGYEAQIAGVGDNSPYQKMLNPVIRFLKKKSIPQIAQRRKEIFDLALEMGFNPEVVNAGGTGSLESSREEECITEVTVGSGFYASHLFDNYKIFKHQPAAAYAIEVVRQPEKNIYTCLGGGYVASGPAGLDKLPQVFLPEGLKMIDNEMAGEVQTPIINKGNENISLGDPIFMRHSKAGELCKHFTHLYILHHGKIEQTVPTYRGEGQCFL